MPPLSIIIDCVNSLSSSARTVTVPYSWNLAEMGSSSMPRLFGMCRYIFTLVMITFRREFFMFSLVSNLTLTRGHGLDRTHAPTCHLAFFFSFSNRQMCEKTLLIVGNYRSFTWSCGPVTETRESHALNSGKYYILSS